MATVSVLNTDAGLSGKTLINAEDAQNITGNKAFNRAPNSPFTVQAGSAVVAELDSDKVDGIHGTALAEIGNTETITSVWTFSAKPAINAGLQFPASQAASSDVNTLDDYEEGSWTPVLGGSGGTSGQTYTTQVGRYIKIGKLVWATFYVVLSAKGTITTSVQIQGLPFTAENTTNLNAICPILWDSLSTSWVNMVGRVAPNTSVIAITGTTAASASSAFALTTADISNATLMSGTIIYQASA